MSTATARSLLQQAVSQIGNSSSLYRLLEYIAGSSFVGPAGPTGPAGPVGPTGPAGPALLFATIAALGAFANAGLSTGQPAFTDDVKDYWSYAPGSNLPIDGITVIAAASGATNRWTRQGIPHQFWQLQATWFISSNGNDTASGDVIGSPIRTWAELSRRVTSTPMVRQDTLITVDVNPPTDAFNFEPLAATGIEIWAVVGTASVVNVDIVAAAPAPQPPDPTTNTVGQFDTVGAFFGVGSFIRIQGSEFYAYVPNTTGTTGMVTSFVDASGAIGSFPVAGDPVEQVVFPSIFVQGASGAKGALTFDKLFLNSSGTGNAPITNAIMSSGFAIDINLHGVTAFGMVAIGCDIQNECSWLSGAIDSGSNVSGTVDLAEHVYLGVVDCEQGTMTCATTGASFILSTSTVRILTPRALYLGTANSLYGAAGTIKIGAMGCLVVQDVTATTISSANSLTWPGGATTAIPAFVGGAVLPAAAVCTTLAAAMAAPFFGSAFEPASAAKISVDSLGE